MSGRLIAAVAVLVLLASTGCRKPAPPEPPTPSPTPLPVGEKGDLGDLPTRNSRFAFELFGQLRTEKPGENLFISPLSVSIALGMTLNGAAGDTAKAITAALQWEGLTVEQVNEGLQSLKAELASVDPQVKLAIADSVWTKRDITFKQPFLDVIRAIPGTKVESLDFEDPASADTINDWVKQNTNGLIETITTPDELSSLMVAILDAVYFKGRWYEVFDKSDTSNAPFTLLDGTTRDVPLMAQSGEYSYLADDTFQAIRLPYADHRTAMYVVLPDKESSLDDLLQDMSAAKWSGWLEKMEHRAGAIKLPRFTAQNTRPLNDALAALGMGQAFDEEKADLSGMSDTRMWLSLVKQKSFVKVDEEGTEAAAVTEVGVAGAAAPAPGEPFEMIVDRPFFIAIVDDQAGTILFMGAIVEPEE